MGVHAPSRVISSHLRDARRRAPWHSCRRLHRPRRGARRRRWSRWLPGVPSDAVGRAREVSIRAKLTATGCSCVPAPPPATGTAAAPSIPSAAALASASARSTPPANSSVRYPRRARALAPPLAGRPKAAPAVFSCARAVPRATGAAALTWRSRARGMSTKSAARRPRGRWRRGAARRARGSAHPRAGESSRALLNGTPTHSAALSRNQRSTRLPDGMLEGRLRRGLALRDLAREM